MSDAARQAPMVNGTQVVAAGFAAATAAFVTSRFGVAGTLLGAALTAMIITGGSALLKAYFESVTGHVRKVPHRLRARREQRKQSAEALPGRPDLRDNFAGRMRAALDWFSHLPPLTRRSILVKGLVAAAVAFVISMAAVWGVEKIINNSLSCGFWANCPQGATPGIHLNNGDARGAGSSLLGGRTKSQDTPTSETKDPVNGPSGVRQDAVQQDELRQDGIQQDGIFRQESRDSERAIPSDSGARPEREAVEPEQPVEPEPPVQPEPPSTASPAPEEPPSGGEAPQRRPQDASPAPRQ